MSDDVRTFALKVDQMVERAKSNIDIVIRKTILDLGTRLVELSPVGNPSMWKSPAPKGYTGGRFKGNWDVSINTVPTTKYDVVDKTGAASIGRIGAKVTSGKSGDMFYICNSLPYARKLEYEGHSKQVPPSGMVGSVVVEFSGILDAAARSVK